MKIVAIETNDFKGLKGYHDFSDIPDGIIGIVGDNGNGKSTLMSAVAYAFYGPDVLETGNADVVTWGQKEAWVSVWFMLDDVPYKVHRRSDGKSTKAHIERAGEPLAQTATEVTNVMVDLLGIDRVGFLASVFSRQEDLLGIGSLQPAKRASTVLRLLQLDRIDAALKKLSETGRDLNKEVGMWRLSGPPMETIKPEDIEGQEKHRQALIAERDEHQSTVDFLWDRTRSLESKVADYNAYAQKRNTLSGELKAAQEEVARAQVEAAQELPPRPEKPDPWMEPSLYESTMREYERALRSQSQSICPTCKRPYDAAGSEEIAREVERLRSWVLDNEAAYKASKAWEPMLVRWDRLEGRRLDAVERQNRAVNLVMDKMDEIDALVPVDNPTEAWNTVNAALRDATSKLNKSKVLLAEVETRLTYMREALAKQEQSKVEYARIESEIRRLEHDIVVNGQTELLMKQYKNALISNVIPMISQRASSLVTEMTEGKYTELALTPQYDIEYRNDNGDLKSFSNLSGGEKDVFALALRLAIADLKAGSVGILVLDEVLESLDPGRQEATWAALERLTSRYNQVFVITHVDTFKDRAPHTITV